MKILQKILKKFDNTPEIIETQEPKQSIPLDIEDIFFGIDSPDQKNELIEKHKSTLEKQLNNINKSFSKSTMTMDSSLSIINSQFPYEYDNNVMDDMLIQNNLFRGFAYYSYYAQVPMINNAINAYVKDILRNGFKLISTDIKNNHMELIEKLNKEWIKFKCDTIIKEMLEKTLGLGGCVIYPKLKGDDKILEKELKVKDLSTIGINTLEYFQIIEPTWVWALGFNAQEPLKPDFYKPQLYNVMGTTIHVSRLIKCVLWELPDLVKPTYQFYGLSLTGKMLQSLRNFEIIQTEIPSMIKRMNYNILKIPLAEGINGKNALISRIKNFLYNVTNFGMFIVNKDNEEFEQVDRNISGLDDLVSRFAELLSTTIQIPVTKLLGVSPKGFSTNDETGHRNWYDLITGIRTTEVQHRIMNTYQYLALNIGIELPDTLTLEWGNLEAINEHDEAKTKEFTAKADIAYVGAGILDSTEVRERLATTPDSGYNNINPNKKIKPPVQSKIETDGKKKVTINDKE